MLLSLTGLGRDVAPGRELAAYQELIGQIVPLPAASARRALGAMSDVVARAEDIPSQDFMNHMHAGFNRQLELGRNIPQDDINHFITDPSSRPLFFADLRSLDLPDDDDE